MSGVYNFFDFDCSIFTEKMQKKCTTGVYRESGEVIFGFQTRMLLFKVTQSDGNRTVGILCHVNDTPSYHNYVISGMSVSSA